MTDGRSDALRDLPVPLRSLGLQIHVSADQLAAAAQDALSTEMAWGLIGEPRQHRSEFSVIQLGSLAVAAGRTSPVALTYTPGDRVTVELCYGGTSHFREGLTDFTSTAGEIILFPNRGGVLCGEFHSGISFHLDIARLRRTAAVLSDCDLSAVIESPQILGRIGSHQATGGGGALFACFRYIDRVLAEDLHLADGLSLDDQIYRLVAFEYCRLLPARPVARRGGGRRCWAPSLDELVDFIRANLASSLTLTDLEERSHYSARHLQNLFRARFDCTPMQFVRRQRLAAAMERLQTDGPEVTVSRIARDCGYRHLSNFSTDFQREFGISPSRLRRRPR